MLKGECGEQAQGNTRQREGAHERSQRHAAARYAAAGQCTGSKWAQRGEGKPPLSVLGRWACGSLACDVERPPRHMPLHCMWSFALCPAHQSAHQSVRPPTPLRKACTHGPWAPVGCRCCTLGYHMCSRAQGWAHHTCFWGRQRRQAPLATSCWSAAAIAQATPLHGGSSAARAAAPTASARTCRVRGPVVQGASEAVLQPALHHPPKCSSCVFLPTRTGHMQRSACWRLMIVHGKC